MQVAEYLGSGGVAGSTGQQGLAAPAMPAAETEEADWVYDVYLPAHARSSGRREQEGPADAKSGQGDRMDEDAAEGADQEDPWDEVPVVEVCVRRGLPLFCERRRSSVLPQNYHAPQVAESDDEFFWAWQDTGSMWAAGAGGMDHDSEDSNAESYFGNSYPDEDEVCLLGGSVKSCTVSRCNTWP